MAEKITSELGEVLQQRKRRSRVVVVNGIFGLGKEKIHRIRIRVPTKQEEEAALIGAHTRVDKMAGEVDAIKNDQDIMADAKSMEIIQQACWTEDDRMQVFVGSDWMRKHFTGDEVGQLMAQVNATRFEESSIVWDFSHEKVESLIQMCVRASSSELPERVLSRYHRDYLNSLVVYLCVRLWEAERQRAGKPPVQVDRNEDGTFVMTFADGDGPDFEPLPADFIDDPEDWPEVADAMPDEDEER